MKAEFIKAKTKVDGSGTGVAKYLSTNNFSVINFVASLLHSQWQWQGRYHRLSRESWAQESVLSS